MAMIQMTNCEEISLPLQRIEKILFQQNQFSVSNFIVIMKSNLTYAETILFCSNFSRARVFTIFFTLPELSVYPLICLHGFMEIAIGRAPLILHRNIFF